MEQIKLTDQLSKHLLKDATMVFDPSSIGLLYELPEVNGIKNSRTESLKDLLEYKRKRKDELGRFRSALAS